ncbi:MAG: hypothetical protein LQ342_002084 [Letrouitia transgressa]|nr:MAG: hypothetical protein LQ342_002084 [Letrouitia transgressa]
MAEGNNPRSEDFERFLKDYQKPPNWPQLAEEDLADPASSKSRYEEIKSIDEGNGLIGGLNEGIRLVQHKETGRRCVEKRVNANMDILVREILLLQVLRHPNIVKYIDGFYDKTAWNYHKAGVYLQYCDLGTVKDLIKKYCEHNGPLPSRERSYIPEAFVWHTFRSLASALRYLHFGIEADDQRSAEELDKVVKSQSYQRNVWPPIRHRDIKPENILLRRKSPKFLKKYHRVPFIWVRKEARYFPRLPKPMLADFGIATQYNEDDWCEEEELIGTIAWMPPELPKSFLQSDVWAVGAVILAMCRQLVNGVVRKPPEDWSEGEVAWSRHRDARKGIRDRGVGENYSRELNEAVYRCLRFDPRNRPHAHKLLTLVKDGEAAARKKGFLEYEEFPLWAFGGRESRLSATRRRLIMSKPEEKVKQEGGKDGKKQKTRHKENV